MQNSVHLWIKCAFLRLRSHSRSVAIAGEIIAQRIMAYNPFAGRYAAVDNPSEEYRFNDLGTDRRQSYSGQGPLSPPANAQYSSSNAIYSHGPPEPYFDVSTAYGGPGSAEYSPRVHSESKYATQQTQRPASIGSTWSGYGNDERAWNELPSDVQGIQTRPSWAQRMSMS